MKTSTKQFLKNWISRVTKLFLFINCCLIINCIGFLIYRLVFVNIFTQYAVTGSDYVNLLIRSLRIDFHSSAQFLLPVLILCILTALLKKGSISNKLALVLSTALSVFAVFGCFANIYFYKTFNSVINTFFFNFLDEDLIALLKTIWSDYPVVSFSISLIVSGYIFYKLFSLVLKKVSTVEPHLNLKTCPVILVFCTLFYIFSYNGGFSFSQVGESRPRAVLFSSISNNKVVNDALSNPTTLMTWMLKEYRKTNKIKPYPVDYAELNDILDSLHAPHDTKEPLNAIIATTHNNQYLENHRPNVVIAYEESFSTHLAQLSNEQNNFDVLGSLKDSINEDCSFDKIISEEGATHPSVIRFTLRIPNEKVTNTKFAKNKYDTFFFKPYKDKGYDTVFITASSCRWGGLDTIFKASGIDELICSDTILKKYPEAKMYTWGQEDAYLFKVAYDRLNEAKEKNKPVAIYLLTSLNHPPYDLPERAQGDSYSNLNFKDHYSKTSFSNYSFDLFTRQIKTFKYAAETLGDFIKNIKADPVHADSTVIAYTGDHNTRISYHDPDKQLIAKGVLTGIYIPEAIKREIPDFSYSKDVIASHKDIMPTLYENTLSDAEYIRLGCNLLSKEPCPFNFAYNVGVTINSKQENSVTYSESGKGLANDPKKLHEAYSRLINWVFNYQINK